MASFNKVILAGNLTRDPELRSLPSGNPVLRMSIAVNRRYNNKDGELREEVTYVDIDAFGKQAETIAKYCTKGSGILVEGRLRLDQWDDRSTGEKRSKLGVVLETFTFIGGGPGGNASRGGGSREEGGSYDDVAPPRRATAAPRSTPPAPQASAPSVEEDIPF